MSGQQNNRRNDQRQQQAPKFDVERELQLFVAALSEPLTVQDYKYLLGPDVDYERFKSSAIDAVSQNWKLLNPAQAFRNSLFFSLKKAAKQGLEPDGVQGALVPRHNSDANCQLVQWQPMVKGIQIAGKRAGVLSSLNAQFVLLASRSDTSPVTTRGSNTSGSLISAKRHTACCGSLKRSSRTRTRRPMHSRAWPSSMTTRPFGKWSSMPTAS